MPLLVEGTGRFVQSGADQDFRDLDGSKERFPPIALALGGIFEVFFSIFGLVVGTAYIAFGYEK